MFSDGFSFSFGDQVIYDHASFSISKSDKIGVIGVNGAGKSTLFKLMLGEIAPTDGAIVHAKDESIGYLPQTIEIDDMTPVLDYIYAGRPIKELQEKRAELEKQMESITDESELKKVLSSYQNVVSLLDYYDEYGADSELLRIVYGVNIPNEILDLPVCEVSGGEKSKVAFAKLLFSRPNILLLDEPTNHLDVESREWVYKYLKSYKGAIVVISHDKNFLNYIVNKVMLVDKSTHSIEMFNGNYSDFEKQYGEYVAAVEKEYKKQKREEKKLLDIIESAEGGSGKRKKMAKSKEKALEKLRANMVAPIKEQKSVKIRMEAIDCPALPLEIENLSFGYRKDHPVIKNLSLKLNKNERLLIAGYNGAGKSTLIKLISGNLTADRGTITINPKTVIAYYDQEQRNLFEDESILDYFTKQGFDQKRIRNLLASYLFFGNEVYKNLRVLSPGERCRIAFADLSLKKANLLILDEPTNHLDPNTQMLVANNFKNYPGAMIVVSHNPEFVETLGVDRMMIMPQQQIKNYDSRVLYSIKERNETYEK